MRPIGLVIDWTLNEYYADWTVDELQFAIGPHRYFPRRNYALGFTSR